MPAQCRPLPNPPGQTCEHVCRRSFDLPGQPRIKGDRWRAPAPAACASLKPVRKDPAAWSCQTSRVYPTATAMSETGGRPAKGRLHAVAAGSGDREDGLMSLTAIRDFLDPSQSLSVWHRIFKVRVVARGSGRSESAWSDRPLRAVASGPVLTRAQSSNHSSQAAPGWARPSRAPVRRPPR